MIFILCIDSKCQTNQNIRLKGEESIIKKTKSEVIELLEERPCLWDIFHVEYAKRDKREVAYTEIAELLNFSLNIIFEKCEGGQTKATKSHVACDFVACYVRLCSLRLTGP